MWHLNRTLTVLCDGVLYPFATLTPLVGLVALSLLTGLLMLVIFRYTSDQVAIGRAKDRVKAHILEMRIFGDDFSVLAGALKRLLLADLAYMKCSLIPMAVMIVPVILILVQANLRYGYRPLVAQERAVVSVKLQPDAPREAILLGLSAPEGIVVETPPLHTEWDGEVDWRIRAERAGHYSLGIEGAGFSVGKSVVVGDRVAAASAVRVGSRFLDVLLNPGEKPLSGKTPIKSISISYPRRTFILFGRRVHWIVIFFVLSIVFAYALKGPLRVEV